jgi:tRNA (guanine37-N1)-methyltransferase
MTAATRFDVVTIFPRMFDALLDEAIVANARDRGILEVEVWDLREFATDKHRSTDDEAYGGGGGMVMLAEPVFRCVDAIRALPGREGSKPWVVEMSPQGSVFDQPAARTIADRGWVVLLCGRYEGFDHRVRDALVDEEISVGDYVVTGGGLPAMLVIDAASRMVDGVVGKRNSVEADSFYEGLLDYPHYTRPAEVRGMKVPEVLISGHFENIRKWRRQESLRATLEKRPDLLARVELDDEARAMIARIRAGDPEGEQNS